MKKRVFYEWKRIFIISWKGVLKCWRKHTEPSLNPHDDSMLHMERLKHEIIYYFFNFPLHLRYLRQQTFSHLKWFLWRSFPRAEKGIGAKIFDSPCLFIWENDSIKVKQCYFNVSHIAQCYTIGWHCQYESEKGQAQGSATYTVYPHSL